MQQPLTQNQLFDSLESLGFHTPQHGMVRKGAIKDFYEAQKTTREGLDYDIDGIVLSVNRMDRLQSLGTVNRNCPRGQIALKFPASTGYAIIKAIEVSPDGAAHLSPVAIFEPIDMMGAEIRRASLKSFRWLQSRSTRVKYFADKYRQEGMAADEAAALAEQHAGTHEQIGVGSIISVKRSGDVIPVVERVVSNLVAKFQLPTCCPTCQGPVCENGAFLDCENDECASKEAARMRRFLVNLKVKGLGQDTLVRYAEVGVTMLDFFQQDGFVDLEEKIKGKDGISWAIWQKIKTQLEA